MSAAAGAGRLVVMGSGETAPTMIKPHRQVFGDVPAGPAVLLDTPYGFQENADEISERAVRYFRDSVGRDVGVVGWRTPPADTVDRERAQAAIRDAAWLFAGPGSPTYALAQWRDTAIPGLVADKLRTGGTVLFASAAAVTLGSHAIPVYEIYKAGHQPAWQPGLDLMRTALGLPAVVVPHYDNAEGGTHDTRFCYLGERRLAALEQDLPDDAFILGVDEHTACVIDLAAGTLTVLGNGTVSVRRRGRTRSHPAGTELPLTALLDELDELDDAAEAAEAAGTAEPAGAATTAPGTPGTAATPGPSLRATAAEIRTRFGSALADRDVRGCVEGLLDLEDSIAAWASDTDQSDHTDRARAELRSMLLRLGDLAERGAADPRSVVGPFVALALDLRAEARAAGDYAASDRIRDGLAAAGVEVRDTPGGVEWVLRDADRGDGAE